MYLYLYAPYLKDKKYARDVAMLEGRITDFGISGKVAQLSQFLKFPAAIKEFGMKRLTTLVVVGNDALLEEAVNQFAESNVVIGFVPMGESHYGSLLGIPSGPSAADVLAARRIAKYDLGKVENRFFLGALRCQGKGIEIHTPTFSLFPTGEAAVEVGNLSSEALPNDGFLEIEVRPIEGSMFKKKEVASSRLHVSSCRLKALKPTLVNCGDIFTLKTPLQVDISREAIRLIVGRRVRK